MRFSFYSQTSQDLQKLFRGYIYEHIAYPDKGSDFDKNLGLEKYLLRAIPCILPLVVSSKLRQRHDALIMHDSVVHGFCAFQDHPDGRHIYRIFVNKSHRGQGYMTLLLEHLINHSLDCNYFRFGGGNHEALCHMHKEFSKKDGLADTGNWYISRTPTGQTRELSI